MEFSTDWLTDNCLMPSDKRNSITAKAMGLIFLLFDVASSLNVPFGTPQYVQFILYGSWTYQFVSHSSLLTTKSVDFVVGM